MVREIIAYKKNFTVFYKAQEYSVQRKIGFVLDLIRYEQNVPAKFFKKLTDSNGIHEIIVITTFKSIRILCFQDEGSLVILTNCFLKKSQKTPIKEIHKAQRLREEYLIEKYGGKQNEEHNKS